MKKLLLVLLMLPSLVWAQEIGIYQPTPAANSKAGNKYAARVNAQRELMVAGSSSNALNPDKVVSGAIDLTSASTATCTGTTSCYTVSTDGYSVANIVATNVSSTGATPVLQMEVSDDGVTWVGAYQFDILNPNMQTGAYTWNSGTVKQINVSVAGNRYLRARNTTPSTTGSATVVFDLKQDPQLASIFGVYPNTVSTALGKAEDNAHASSDIGVFALGVYQSTPSQLAGTTLDYSPISTGPEGGVYTQAIAGSVGGATIANVISAATNNATVVKASAGSLLSVTACNINAAVRYLKLYNKASAPTCGTDTPVMRIPLPVNNCAPINLPAPGLAFATGIGYCIVTGATDADNTATAANEQFVTIGYK